MRACTQMRAHRALALLHPLRWHLTTRAQHMHEGAHAQGRGYQHAGVARLPHHATSAHTCARTCPPRMHARMRAQGCAISTLVSLGYLDATSPLASSTIRGGGRRALLDISRETVKTTFT